MSCPECKTEFQIPQNGFAEFRVRTMQALESAESCKVCSTDQVIIPAITVYCTDCYQDLCICSYRHMEEPHDVEVSSLLPSDGQYCDKHKKRARFLTFVWKKCIFGGRGVNVDWMISFLRWGFARL